MKIKMKITKRISEDGFKVMLLRKDEIYDLVDHNAAKLIRKGYAEEVE